MIAFVKETDIFTQAGLELQYGNELARISLAKAFQLRSLAAFEHVNCLYLIQKLVLW